MRLPKILAAGLAACLFSPVFGGDETTYRDGVLTVPNVSTDAQVGQYQNAVLEMDAQGLWRLKTILALNGDPGLSLLPIQSVEVIKTDTVPVQVFLRISGYLPDGCSGIGRFVSRRVETRFEAALFDSEISSSTADYACTMSIMPFVKSFPLDVYGLGAGSYTYAVNGLTGSFELTADNVLPGDCFGSSTCQN